MAGVASISVGKELCGVLGLDPDDITGILISFEVGSAVEVTVGRRGVDATRWVTRDECEHVIRWLDKYELVKKGS